MTNEKQAGGSDQSDQKSNKLVLGNVKTADELVAYANDQHQALLKVLTGDGDGDTKIAAVSKYREGLPAALAELDPKERLEKFITWYTTYRESKKSEGLQYILQETDLFSMTDPTILMGIIIYASQNEINEGKKLAIWNEMVGDKDGVMTQEELATLFTNLREYDLEGIKGDILMRLLARELVSFGLSTSTVPPEAYADLPQNDDTQQPAMPLSDHTVSLEAHEAAVEVAEMEAEQEDPTDEPSALDETSSDLVENLRKSLTSELAIGFQGEEYHDLSGSLTRVLEALGTADFAVYQAVIAELTTALEEHAANREKLLALVDSDKDFNVALTMILEKLGYTLKKEAPKAASMPKPTVSGVKMSARDALIAANLWLEKHGSGDLVIDPDATDPGVKDIEKGEEGYREDDLDGSDDDDRNERGERGDEDADDDDGI